MSLQMSSSQTIGPYLHIGTDWLKTTEMAGPGVPGQRIGIEGRVYDGNGAPVTDALVELWQADAQGNYAGAGQPGAASGFRGFGRAPTDATGHFRFSTILPGAVPGPGDSMQAPHIAVTVFARGLLKHLVTRIYFPDGAGHAGDALLNAVPAERRATLIAQPSPSGQAGSYQFDIVLQEGPGGRPETVFLDV
ncbi:protocatechuate 3,4-dioxygenase subunit alpha [Noviherbaspirillum soli]|uniref:protocatechuate 3,4-dioxygenase subunit alpha n=1 Tax=Noviherbaspirillum soli TaxID=1064518 RepID=UPI00188DC58E|nr:protocatechuate 3,4-dioxygenase subunit alpha [Noviherbaspirillum soli]